MFLLLYCLTPSIIQYALDPHILDFTCITGTIFQYIVIIPLYYKISYTNFKSKNIFSQSLCSFCLSLITSEQSYWLFYFDRWGIYDAVILLVASKITILTMPFDSCCSYKRSCRWRVSDVCVYVLSRGFCWCSWKDRSLWFEVTLWHVCQSSSSVTYYKWEWEKAGSHLPPCWCPFSLPGMFYFVYVSVYSVCVWHFNHQLAQGSIYACI